MIDNNNTCCSFCETENIEVKRFNEGGPACAADAKGVADRVQVDLCIFCRHLHETNQLHSIQTLYPHAPTVKAMVRIAHIMLAVLHAKEQKPTA